MMSMASNRLDPLNLVRLLGPLHKALFPETGTTDTSTPTPASDQTVALTNDAVDTVDVTTGGVQMVQIEDLMETGAINLSEVD